MILGLCVTRRPFLHGTKMAENWHSFADDTIMIMCYNYIVQRCIQLYIIVIENIARAAREGKNPQTGEKIKIAACKVPAFKAGKAFKDLVK